MSKRIVLIEDPPINTCVGCRTCESACAFWHERAFNPEKSRIRVIRTEYGISYPIICRQCFKAPCVDACPTRAVHRNAETGVVLVNEGLCIGCGLCVERCPFGAIVLHPDKKVAIKCDLCGGAPACVKFCPERVLRYVDANIMAQDRRRSWAESKVGRGA